MISAPSDPVEVKVCCAATYGSDAMAVLLGDSYHPGGVALTTRLLDAVSVTRGHTLLDVASGRGTSTLLAATTYGAAATGIDLSEENVTAATRRARETDIDPRPDFRLGDAESLPVSDNSFDVVICECALCTFPDKSAAVHQIARVLRPGGRVGITDITADQERLPNQLRGLAATIACVADARPAEHYVSLLEDADLRVTRVEPHDDALRRMIDRIEARLTVATKIGTDWGFDPAVARVMIRAARTAVDARVLGYALITASAD